ncbi:MAG: zinc-binding dehydrogenase, partial [Pirellulales bacterium]
QYVVVPEENLWPVHDAIPDQVAAIFDPLGNAMHTVMSAGVSGRSVLITGVGTIGLMAVMVARAAGAQTILVSDPFEHRLALARKFGADHGFIAGDPNLLDEVRRLTRGEGAEVLLEMSGNPRAIRQGLAALQNGGTAALLGLPAEDISLNLPNDVIFKGLTVLGINGRRMFETWYQVESVLLSRQVDPRPIITHEIDMAEFDRGIKLMQAGEAIKVVMRIPQ